MARYFSKPKWDGLFSVLSHPMQSFYEIRHREAGSVPLGVLMLLLFGITYSINQIFASFVVSDVDPRSVNLLTTTLGVIVLFMLFAVANWSITCLMNGEGRFQDIVTAVGYALLPLVITWIPATLLSQVIADSEQVFYTLIIWVGIIWAFMLMLIGIMTVHNFTLAKTIGTLVLTAVSMFIIIFVVLLLVNLMNQVYMFFYSVYQELIYRS